MGDVVLKIVGMAFLAFVVLAVVFQVAAAFGGVAWVVACAVGIAVMVALPIGVLRLFFGPTARLGNGGWGGIATITAIFALSLFFYGMSGQVDGGAAAAMVLLPGFVTFVVCLRGGR